MKKVCLSLCLFLNLNLIFRAEAQFRKSVLKELEQWLAQDQPLRPALAEQPFANRPISRKEAEKATNLLLADRKKYIASSLTEAWERKEFRAGSYAFKFEYKIFGDKPAEGRSLYISLHGGGGTTAAVNDQQWRNQVRLYTPAEGIYLAPRSPTDTWNMWHQEHIDGFLSQLIQSAIVLQEVNPDKVYIMGYSAGGDGVFQLAPRLADHWAAAAMMAGHPGDATALNLRNIGFTIHMGGKDAAYKRNELAKTWSGLLDSLQLTDPTGYAHMVQIHADRPHWMNRLDTVAVPWLAKFKRNPLPEKVLWQQDDVLKTQFYWLGVPTAQAKTGRQLIATRKANTINILKSDYDTAYVYLNDKLLNLNKPVVVQWQGQRIFKGKVKRNMLPIWQAVESRTDKNLIFSYRLVLSQKKVLSTGLPK